MPTRLVDCTASRASSSFRLNISRTTTASVPPVASAIPLPKNSVVAGNGTNKYEHRNQLFS